MAASGGRGVGAPAVCAATPVTVSGSRTQPTGSQSFLRGCPFSLSLFSLVHARSLSSFCQSYDMKQHSTKVFRDIVNALGSFIQSLFIAPHAGTPATVSAPAGQSPHNQLDQWYLWCLWSDSATSSTLSDAFTVQGAQVRDPRARRRPAWRPVEWAGPSAPRLRSSTEGHGSPLLLSVSRAVPRPHSESRCFLLALSFSCVVHSVQYICMTEETFHLKRIKHKD